MIEVITILLAVLFAGALPMVAFTTAALIAGAGAAAGAAGGLLSAGGKPDIPEIGDVDPQRAQRTALRGNLASFEQNARLARRVNKFNQQQFEQALSETFPEFSETAKAISENLQQQAQGEIPQDVSDAVQRSAAAQAVGGGFAGSGLQRDLTARDLGLTSLQVSNQALKSASRWLATVRSQGPQQFDVTSSFVSPQTQIQTEMQNRQLQFRRNLLAAGVEAAPSPTEQAIGGTLQGLGGAAMNVGAFGMGSALAPNPGGMGASPTMGRVQGAAGFGVGMIG